MPSQNSSLLKWEAPHPPTPSPREFGQRLMKMAKVKSPNLRGEGEPEWFVLNSFFLTHSSRFNFRYNVLRSSPKTRAARVLF